MLYITGPIKHCWKIEGRIVYGYFSFLWRFKDSEFFFWCWSQLTKSTGKRKKVHVIHRLFQRDPRQCREQLPVWTILPPHSSMLILRYRELGLGATLSVSYSCLPPYGHIWENRWSGNIWRKSLCLLSQAVSCHFNIKANLSLPFVFVNVIIL